MFLSMSCLARARERERERMSSDLFWCYKTLFGGNLENPKIKKLNKVCSDVWTCTKMGKLCFLKLNYTILYFFISCCFSYGGDLEFLDFLQKKFYNINYWTKTWPQYVSLSLTRSFFSSDLFLGFYDVVPSWQLWSYLHKTNIILCTR